MAHFLGLGLTHYPLLAGTDEHLADLLRWTLADPDIPAGAKDPAGWPAPMRAEWGTDGGVASAAHHRKLLVENLARCRDALDEFGPDVVVVWGDDQYENFREEVVPPFCVLAYGDVEVCPFELMSRRGSPNAWGLPDDMTITLHGDAEGARRLADELIRRGFDIAYSYQKRSDAPFPHAIVNTQLFLDYPEAGSRFDYRIIPITVNCYGQHAIARRGGLARFADIADERLDPSGPTPARCFALGRAVAQAFRNTDLRVALVASSSWSHAFLTDKTWHITPDTAADRRLYQLFVDHDYATWQATPSRDIVDSGQHEMLNWFCLTGAVDELGLHLAWSELVTTDVFNSNKCFAVFCDRGREERYNRPRTRGAIQQRRPAVTPIVVEDTAAQRFRVHRSAMTSPRIHRAEIERIFAKSWLYVGHESEIPKPGDFVRRPVGGRPVFMVRGVETGNVNVFHNSCTHRGALVCRQDSGHSKVFQCFYHAWTFDSEGRLKGVPDRDAYSGGVKFDELGLKRVERAESYRGFVFASFDPDIADLPTYLAGAKDYLDLVIDGCGGSVEIVRGTNQYSFGANWKLLVENSIDGYHAESTHDTYFKYLVSIGTDLRGGVSGRAVDLGNGHAVIEYTAPWGRPVANWEPLFGEDARTEIDRLRADLVTRHGEQRAQAMAEVNRNMLIYPNLIINDIMAVTVRTFYPPAPDAVDVTAWELAPADELPTLRQRRLDSFLTFLGPGGFATPDDLEALESCQQGFASGGVAWNDISRGMGRAPKANDEEQMRAFWRRWQHQMAEAADLAGAQ